MSMEVFAFLTKLIQYNIADGNLSPNAIGAYFEDQTLGIKIGSSDGKFARYIFAANANSETVVVHALAITGIPRPIASNGANGRTSYQIDGKTNARACSISF